MSTDAGLREPGDYSQAIGRTERKTAVIAAERVSAMANLLDLHALPGSGGALPPAWHWLFFNPFVRRRELGVDGHPQRGGFLPDVKLPRRMWAGGRLAYLAPVPIGATVERESEIADVSAKSGRAGQLVFVTVRHRIFHAGTLCVEEEQDIVYREAPAADTPPPKPQLAPDHAQWSEPVTPDPVLLFRYSALTYNGHRIHYDRPYATGEEGYRDLVVHGPLISTLLHGLAERCRPKTRLRRFEFRAMAPLFVDRGFTIEAAQDESNQHLNLWAKGPDGELAMRADASFFE